jgi:putative CocE/NonD family hydrolase
VATIRALALTAALLASAPALAQTPVPPAAPAPQTVPAPPFDYREMMIPMRDGARLQTVILTPHDASGPLPILLNRTPYGVPPAAPKTVPTNFVEFQKDGYIYVIQNIRGRFKSEGTFSLSEDSTVTPGQGTIETRDAYDTIDWLVKNVPNNNGKVGITGVSYSGYTAGATLLGPHPALKAVSEQASPTNQWMNDDDHRYGALRLSYDFEYAVLEEADKTTNTHFQFDVWDTYQWYLGVGPLANLNDRYLHGKIRYWNEATQHPDYDQFWKDQAWADSLHASTVPTLNVAGFWDQEDPWGPWQIFRHEEEHDPDATSVMASGPWWHGGWHAPKGDTLGLVPLGHDTAREFREQVEAPFFAYWLHGKGDKPSWKAVMFETGSGAWRTYPAWPPSEAKPTSLYLHADGSLSFDAPAATEAGAYRDYVSDPANPVPYRPRPISPTYPGGDWRTWESGDQRFVDHRPDVLTFVSAPLDHDVRIAGPVSAELFASTSGTDSDFVVKLIDVYPEDAQKPDWSTDDGPKPGDFAKSMNGYELPIAMEVRRGRYLDSFETPHALTPDKPTRWDVPLRDRDHVFLKGHRIMVQIQSSWFPLIDRNPQTFTPSIYAAQATDFVKATQKVYAAPDLASRIILPVMPQ